MQKTMSASNNDISVVMELADRPVPSLTGVERNVRNAAVKVVSPSGHGSGTYIRFYGFDVVLTAAHVVDGSPEGTVFFIEGNEEQVPAKIIYLNEEIDVAALILESELTTRSPIRHRNVRNTSRIGTKLVYSGYPSSHNLLTIRGMVAGYGANNGTTVILMHSFGWFGCSGSGVYDEAGNFVGILWGIEIQGAFGAPQLIEDIIWITPSNQIEYSLILSSACALSDNEPFACRRFR